jgi:hypothetical protein
MEMTWQGRKNKAFNGKDHRFSRRKEKQNVKEKLCATVQSKLVMWKRPSLQLAVGFACIF